MDCMRAEESRDIARDATGKVLFRAHLSLDIEAVDEP